MTGGKFLALTRPMAQPFFADASALVTWCANFSTNLSSPSTCNAPILLYLFQTSLPMSMAVSPGIQHHPTSLSLVTGLQ